MTMLGFVPVPLLLPTRAATQVEVPKYVWPRTFTPERAFGIGGAFSSSTPCRERAVPTVWDLGDAGTNVAQDRG